jgi:hypothetical protein
LIQAGLDEASIGNLTNPNDNVSDSVQHLAYLGMLNVTGTDLEQVLAIFGVTTKNINTMADLLNPAKIFPNSLTSLTVRTYNQDTTSVLRAIYDNTQGTVNSKLLIYLPRYVLTLGTLNIISYERLARIIPADQALACKAIQVGLQQIKNINNLVLPQLAAAFVDMQTTRDLPSISALEQAVPASVAAFYSSSYATGTGPDGTLVITDLLGAAVGVTCIHTRAAEAHTHPHLHPHQHHTQARAAPGWLVRNAGGRGQGDGRSQPSGDGSRQRPRRAGQGQGGSG